MASGRSIRLLLMGGDSMLGRGVQLSAFHRTPGEEAVKDSMPASHYLDISLHPSDPTTDLPLSTIRELNKDGRYLWGDYLNLPISPAPQLRLLNLETSVTDSIANPDVPFYKGITYHLNPANLRALLAAFASERHSPSPASSIPYALVFSNNHAMDFGRRAFQQESLPAMSTLPGRAALVGAGPDLASASRPAVFPLPGATVRVLAATTQCAGTPPDWASGPSRPGLLVLPPLRSQDAVPQAFQAITTFLEGQSKEQEEDIVPVPTITVLSIHWGPNWAAPPGDGQPFRRELAHRLVDAGLVDVVYGHSSHHVRGLELYRGKLIVYGAGDLVNDYEGFENRGEEQYVRLGALMLLDLDAASAQLLALRLVPMFVDRLRLRRVVPESRFWRPLLQRSETAPNAVHDFHRFLNAMSLADAGKHALQLRVVDHDPDVPGGPNLVYP